MEIPIENSQSVIIAEIPVKELDASNAGDLKNAMAQILENSPKVVMDVRRMQFIDSSGLGAILSCLRQVSAKGGDLKLCCMTRQVRAAFELVRMNRIFDIFETREDAVHAFSVSNGAKI
jgi:anti-sigma B factor antagonist